MMLGSCTGPVLPESEYELRTLFASAEYDSPAGPAEAELTAPFEVADALVLQAEINNSDPLNTARPKPFANIKACGKTLGE